MTEPVAPATGLDPVASRPGDAPRPGARTPEEFDAASDTASGEAANEHGGAAQTSDTRADAAAAHSEIIERIDDLTRVVARQAATIERLADDAKARAQRERHGADLPLVIELFALLGDTTACAGTAETPRERAAFEAVAARIERLLTGRGGILVAPGVGDAFDALTMEAADVVRTDVPDADRTVASLIQPGLSIPGRSVRPARVVVRQYRKSEGQR
ncbi:nucleotide exchange factor GrpE [Nocardia sp. NPDC005366]|uniref:nucleotide exchange factor GrpE n=1 Tax=Nocardia sp. NPDC005366 TaxID=3156878 RepID=UPI0033B78798